MTPTESRTHRSQYEQIMDRDAPPFKRERAPGESLKSPEQSQDKTSLPPKCPNCGKRLETVWVTTDTTAVWQAELGCYQEDRNLGTAEERCPYCEMKYPCDDERGNVSCYDVQKQVRRPRKQ